MTLTGTAMMKKIKVLRIIARLNVGGPAIHTVLLTQGLDKERFESLLVCGQISNKEGDMAYYAREKGVRPLYIRQLRRELNPLNDLAALFKILGIIKREKPGIIHTHTAKAGALGRLAAIAYNFWVHFSAGHNQAGRNTRLCQALPPVKIKLFHTFHGHVFDGYFNRFLSKIFILIEKILALFTDKIITVSDEVKKELITLKIAKAGKIAVIPLGFELEKFLAITSKQQEEIIRVGIVGRLVPIKNHWLFLKAARKVKYRLLKEGRSLRVRFLIIGDGELRGELEEFSRALNIADCVEFLGWQKDLAKVYSGLDIVCLSSLNEGTPVSLIEAMASEKAVVATDVGGVGDLLGEIRESRDNFLIRERGISIKPKDAQGLADGLSFAIENVKISRDMAKAARVYVKDRFSKQRLIQDMEMLYQDIAVVP